MTAQTPSKEQQLLRQTVVGSRRASNYLSAAVVTIGGIGFLLAGISSYLRVSLLPFSDPTRLVFIPQGLRWASMAPWAPCLRFTYG